VRIAVMGAGGVGGYFGGRLAEAGHQVTFIARGRNLDKIRTDGLRITAPETDTTIGSVGAADDPASAGEADVVLVAVKSWQVPEVAASLKPLLAEHTVVLPLENGVEAPGRLATALGAQHVFGGVCVIISYLAEPGHVHHVGGTPSIQLGPIEPGLPDSIRRTAAELREALTGAGVECTDSPDIHRAMWRKFLLITSYGGVGAVTGQPVGVTRQLTETRELIEEAMNEVSAVARARGVGLDAEDVRSMMRQVDAFAPESTASMQRDLAAGRPSELNDQNGAVVRLGAQSGVDTPVHRFIHTCLLPAENQARGA
jgi:2-dehydropantoate 2-reductase